MDRLSTLPLRVNPEVNERLQKKKFDADLAACELSSQFSNSDSPLKKSQRGKTLRKSMLLSGTASAFKKKSTMRDSTAADPGLEHKPEYVELKDSMSKVKMEKEDN